MLIERTDGWELFKTRLQFRFKLCLRRYVVIVVIALCWSSYALCRGGNFTFVSKVLNNNWHPLVRMGNYTLA